MPGVSSNESSKAFHKNVIDQAFLPVAQTSSNSLLCFGIILPVMRITLYLCLVNDHIDEQSQEALARFLF